MNTIIVTCSECGTRNRVAANAGNNRKAVCGKCGAGLEMVPAKPVEVTDANFENVISRAELPVILDLWAPWCGPCRMIAPIIEQLATEFAGRAIVGKLNTDQNQRTAAAFSVQGIPTILFLKQGREVDRIVGVADKATIRRRFETIL